MHFANQTFTGGSRRRLLTKSRALPLIKVNSPHELPKPNWHHVWQTLPPKQKRDSMQLHRAPKMSRKQRIPGGRRTLATSGGDWLVVRHSRLVTSLCLRGNYDDLQNWSRSVIIINAAEFMNVAECFTSKNTVVDCLCGNDRQILQPAAN